MFPFSIATVDKILFEGEVASVTAPGASGELTILANHMPIITTLKEGKVIVRIGSDKKEQEFEVSGGLLEASSNRATILV